MIIALTARKNQRLQESLNKIDIYYLFNELNQSCVDFILRKVYDHRAGMFTVSGSDA